MIFPYVDSQSKWDVETPVLILNLNAVEANIQRMASFFKGKSCQLRPHAKTHKLPLIAQKQMEAGAIGITCAKLSEAQIFLEHGLKEILIANQVVGSTKIRRLIGLTRLGRILVCIDNIYNAVSISNAATENGTMIDVLVEVDVGLGRCGTQPGSDTLNLVQEIDRLPGLNFQGLMGYEGGCFIKDQKEKAAQCRRSINALIETRDLVRKAGVETPIISAGGSNTYNLTGLYAGVTEIQVGSYVTMDTFNSDYGLDFANALTVLATVISRSAANRAVIDAGLKSLSNDHGLSKALTPGVTLVDLKEEHGYLVLEHQAQSLKVGDKVEIIPSHGCTTIPLHSLYVLTRGDRIVDLAPIAARGALF